MLRLLLALVIVFPLAALPGSAEAQRSVRPAKAKLRTKTARVKRLWPAAKRALLRRKPGRSGSSRLRANGNPDVTGPARRDVTAKGGQRDVPDVTGPARSFRSPLDGSLRRDVTGRGRKTDVPDVTGPTRSFRSPLDGSLRRDVTGGGAARQKRETGVPDRRGPAPSFFRRDTRKPSRPTEGPRSGPRELGGGRA
jgi:hypothetical protein